MAHLHSTSLLSTITLNWSNAHAFRVVLSLSLLSRSKNHSQRYAQKNGLNHAKMELDFVSCPWNFGQRCIDSKIIKVYEICLREDRGYEWMLLFIMEPFAFLSYFWMNECIENSLTLDTSWKYHCYNLFWCCTFHSYQSIIHLSW